MKKRLVFNLMMSMLFFLTSLTCFSQGEAKKPIIGNEQKIEEWKDARFGMFIHWGPVSLKGTEIGWSRGSQVPVEEYDNLYKQFNPVKFNADEWVSVAKAAGMKYIVLTTKHHDGFCLWNTRQTDFNIMSSPFRRDVVKELSEACRKQGIAFGAYYSTCDWHHPDFPLTSPGGSKAREKSDLEAYTHYLKRQVAELLLNYGPLITLWFDVPQKFDAVRGQGIIDFAHQIQPDIIINSRTGARGDYDNPEQRVGGFQNERPWETCMTIGNQWAWKPNEVVKSLEQCIQSLIRSAGGDGNLLFNVGPKPDGEIEPLQVARLKEMGQWLQQYGTSVYGTRGGPFKPTDWGVSTRKGNHIYLHILNWYGSQVKISLPDIGVKIKSCKILNGKDVKISQKEGRYTLELSSKDLKAIDTILDIEADSDVMQIKPIEIQSQSLSYNKKATASTNPNPNWNGVASITNGDWVGHFWRPAKDDKQPWAEVDLGKPEKISKAIIYESGSNVTAFEIQALQGDQWKTIFKGSKIGPKGEFSLSKVSTQKVRLMIQSYSSTPGIYEFVIL